MAHSQQQSYAPALLLQQLKRNIIYIIHNDSGCGHSALAFKFTPRISHAYTHPNTPFNLYCTHTRCHQHIDANSIYGVIIADVLRLPSERARARARAFSAVRWHPHTHVDVVICACSRIASGARGLRTQIMAESCTGAGAATHSGCDAVPAWWYSRMCSSRKYVSTKSEILRVYLCVLEEAIATHILHENSSWSILRCFADLSCIQRNRGFQNCSLSVQTGVFIHTGTSLIFFCRSSFNQYCYTPLYMQVRCAFVHNAFSLLCNQTMYIKYKSRTHPIYLFATLLPINPLQKPPTQPIQQLYQLEIKYLCIRCMCLTALKFKTRQT